MAFTFTVMFGIPVKMRSSNVFLRGTIYFTCLLSKYAVPKKSLTVGHLPREISRPTKYLLNRGATIVAKLTATHYKKSPLFQWGDLEIPCEVTVSMPGSIKGHMLLQCYQNMVEELYCQPKEEVIMGSFIDKNVRDIEPVRAKKRRPLKRQKNRKDAKIFETFFKRGIQWNLYKADTIRSKKKCPLYWDVRFIECFPDT